MTTKNKVAMAKKNFNRTFYSILSQSDFGRVVINSYQNTHTTSNKKIE